MKQGQAMRLFLKLFMLTSVVLLLVSVWRSHVLPERSRLQSSLQEEPVQREIRVQAFQVSAGGVVYTVQPRYEYDLYGLVVSKHNADTWWDFVHREAGDALNITDLCVVWGNNIRSDVYRQLQYWSGQFTCFVQADTAESAAAFDMTALSNNHLLTERDRLAKLLRRVEVGDQIHFHGYLAEYSHNHGFAFHRGTSITRTDTGNGACETVYVDDFSILRQGGSPWRILRWVAGLMLVAGVLGWFLQPPRFDD
jgi:hypothetical protein